jgi:hypothetical protein
VRRTGRVERHSLGAVTYQSCLRGSRARRTGEPLGRRPFGRRAGEQEIPKHKQRVNSMLFVFGDLVLTARAKRGPTARQRDCLRVSTAKASKGT